jgi:alpha-L-arabinofuranosidase
VAIDLKGIKPGWKDGTVQMLYSSNPAEFNKLSALEKLKPEIKTLTIKSQIVKYELPPSSVTVMNIPLLKK